MTNYTHNFNNSIIYKLCCKNTDITDIYVGSTTNFLNRQQAHKYQCNTPYAKDYNLRLYTFIRDNGGWDNWDMVQLKSFKCNNKQELIQAERDTYEELNPTLNTNVPNRNFKEYYTQNLDYVKLLFKNYYSANREKIVEQKKQYNRDNKERIKAYEQTDEFKERRRIYMREYRKRRKGENSI